MKDKKRVKGRNNQQKRYYSGKKKRHTMKVQLVVNKKSHLVMCTHFSNGKKHDFKLFVESKVRWHKTSYAITDTGYRGVEKICTNVVLPKKTYKKNPLTKQDKKHNRIISSWRALNENVIGLLKRFKIICDKYRNRRKRFGLRYNLIAGIYNYEVLKK